MSVRSILTHPIMALVVILVACRIARDFYPLNSFPMYADPGPEPSEYVVVTDGNDQPVDIMRLTGETSAKVKKKYIDARNDMASAAGIKTGGDATSEICNRAWGEIVGRLGRLAERRNKDLPEVMRLKLGEIYQDETGFREEFKTIGEASFQSSGTPGKKKP